MYSDFWHSSEQGRRGPCLFKHNPLRILYPWCSILGSQLWKLGVQTSQMLVRLWIHHWPRPSLELMVSLHCLIFMARGFGLSNCQWLYSWTNIYWCWFRNNSCVLRLRLCNCNKVRWRGLGFSKTWNICSNYGLLLIWEATVSGLNYCSFYGYSYSWSIKFWTFSPFLVLHDMFYIPLVIVDKKNDFVECFYVLFSWFFLMHGMCCRMTRKLLQWLKNCWKLVYDLLCRTMVGISSTLDLIRMVRPPNLHRCIHWDLF